MIIQRPDQLRLDPARPRMPILAPRGATPLDKGAPRLCARCEISENPSGFRKLFISAPGLCAVRLTRCPRAGCAFCVRAPDSDKRLDLDSEGLADAPPLTPHQPPPAQGWRASDDDAKALQQGIQ